MKKFLGGGRITAPPPYVYSGPALPAADLSGTAERIAAPLVFAKPANIDPFETMFGMVRLSHKDEPWPVLEGEPLAPLLQINLTHAPMVQGPVHDLCLISIFISEAHSTVPTQIIDSRTPDPSANWVLRSYTTQQGLTIPRPPKRRNHLKPLLGEWGPIGAEARPDYENGGAVLAQPLQSKLGGWPVPLHGKPWWAGAQLNDTWDFVMQVENVPAAGWHGWGRGAACIARSRERPHLWAIDVVASSC
ncbi:MAG: hypothetical protein ABJJ53_03540 [Sulfitobacter sp.]